MVTLRYEVNLTDMKANILEKLMKLDRIDSDVSELKTERAQNLMKPCIYSKGLSSKRSEDSEDVSASRSQEDGTSIAHSQNAARKRSRKSSLGESIGADSDLELPSIEQVPPLRKGRNKLTFGTRRSDSGVQFASSRPPVRRHIYIRRLNCDNSSHLIRHYCQKDVENC